MIDMRSSRALMAIPLLAACADCPAPFEASALSYATPGQRVVVFARDGDLRVEARERAALVEVEVHGCTANGGADQEGGAAPAPADIIRVDTTGADLGIDIAVPTADVRIVVPAGASLELTHGDGAMRVRRVVGDVDIRDTGGPIYIDVVMGSVRVRDGSGGIHAHDIAGDVIVEDDGSGEIDVRGVGGDFVVREKREDRLLVRHADVAGRVPVPRRRAPR